MAKKKAVKNVASKRKTQTVTAADKQNKTRVVKKPQYKSFRIAKRIKPDLDKPLSSSWKIFRSTVRFLRDHKRLFVGISVVYFVLSLLLGYGMTAISLDDIRFELEVTTGGELGSIATGLTLFSYLISSGNSTTSAQGSTYLTLLTVLVSVVSIWALRQTMAGRKVSVKQAYYNGTSALIPFILVLLIIGIQFLPMMIGGWLYNTLVSGGVATLFIEKAIWTILFFLLSLLSLYLVSSSVFAAYIVNLPGVKPIQALRSARALVRHRRFMLMRRIIFLPIALMIIGAFVLVPLLVVVPSIATWLYMLLSAFAVVFAHMYMYHLYRELL